jgi:hypothetical protein
MPPPAPYLRRPSTLALVVLAVLGCASGLAAAHRPANPAVPLRAIVERSDKISRRAPSFELIPQSRREDAVLRSQPELQILAAGTTSARAKQARFQAARTGRQAAFGGGARRGGDADRGSGLPSGIAAARLRAPPSPT